MAVPEKSNEVMSLCVMMFANLIQDQPEILRQQSLLDDWLMGLLHYTTYEVRFSCSLRAKADGELD